MWASEFGQDTWDGLNLIQPGRNYGWPGGAGSSNRAGFADPVPQWRPADASPSGIAYAEDAIWMAGLRGERLWRIPLGGSKVAGEPSVALEGSYGRLRTVMAAGGDRLWLATSNTYGKLPGGGDDRILLLRCPEGTPRRVHQVCCPGRRSRPSGLVVVCGAVFAAVSRPRRSSRITRRMAEMTWVTVPWVATASSSTVESKARRCLLLSTAGADTTSAQVTALIAGLRPCLSLTPVSSPAQGIGGIMISKPSTTSIGPTGPSAELLHSVHSRTHSTNRQRSDVSRFVDETDSAEPSTSINMPRDQAG